jgi:amidase
MDSLPAVLIRYLRGGHDDAETLAHPERLERRTRGFARVGGLIPESLLERSLAGEEALRSRLGRVLEQHDVLLTPAVATLPPAIGRLQGRGALWTLNTVGGWVPYNGIWNVTGQPAAAVPAGFSESGLPLSVQLVGRPADEATLLSLAGQMEAARPWAEHRPAGFS